MLVKYLGETKINSHIKLNTIINGGIYIAYHINKYEDVELVGVSGSYNKDLFETLDGEPLRYIETNDYDVQHVSSWKDEELDEGDMFVCISPNLKTLTFGKVYTLNDFKSGGDWNLSFCESKTKRKYGRHNFSKLSKKFIRELKLNDLIGIKDKEWEQRFVHDDISVINYKDKVNIMFDIFQLAREYKEYTKVRNISILDIMKLFNHHLIDDEDLDRFVNTDFSKLIIEK